MFGSFFRNGIPPVDKRLRAQAAVLAAAAVADMPLDIRARSWVGCDA